MNTEAIVPTEEKGLVFSKRSAGCGPKLVLPVRGRRGRKEPSGIQRIVAEVLIERTVKLVGPGL